MRKCLCLAAFPGMALVVALSAPAADPKRNPKEEQALQKRAEDYIAAFNKGDAKALAAFWTPDGDFVDLAGNHTKGRKALEEAFQKLFANAKGAKLRLFPTAIRFVTPDLAIEDGESEVAPPDGGPPTAARYTVVHVKKDGEWYLESVREAVAVAPSNYKHLSELEWLIGDWANEDSKAGTARVSYSWTGTQNFILSSSELSLKDVPMSGATQWIGWDPSAKQIRSWSFESNGGFGEGVWAKDGAKWAVKIAATMHDGKKMTMTNVFTKVDADHFTWQSTKRSLDGKPAPDSLEVKMKRQK